jgi:hypothetical protein
VTVILASATGRPECAIGRSMHCLFNRDSKTDVSRRWRHPSCQPAAVFTPITRPGYRPKGPPEVPELIAASVWIMPVNAPSPCVSIVRPRAEMIPRVTSEPVGAENPIRTLDLDFSMPLWRLVACFDPVGVENLIRWLHAASLYSWIRPPSRSDLRSRAASGHGVGDAGDIESRTPFFAAGNLARGRIGGNGQRCLVPVGAGRGLATSQALVSPRVRWLMPAPVVASRRRLARPPCRRGGSRQRPSELVQRR